MKEGNKLHVTELRDVSETLLIPLFFRAKETVENGLIQDHAAVDIVNQIQYDFRKMATDWKTQILIVVRTQILDEIVEEYVASTKNPVIINLGAGLDTRHLRFQNVKWYQLDLEKPMSLRTTFFGTEAITIIKSILDFSWIKEIEEKEDVLIIIEGVLMYLTEVQVRSIFKHLGLNFKRSQIVFDTIPKSYVKLQKHKSINIKRAPLQWGNSALKEIEKWGDGFVTLKSYRYLSKHRRRWKASALLSIFPAIYNGFKISRMKIN